MDPSKIPLNQISWTEIPCTDLARARSFYEQVFGWTCIPASEMMKPGEKDCDSKNDELVFFSLGNMRGSFILVEKSNFLSPAVHPSNESKSRIAVRVTISVTSVDESLASVEKAGGRLYIAKKDLGNNMGHTAYFEDCEGNVMGLWSMV